MVVQSASDGSAQGQATLADVLESVGQSLLAPVAAPAGLNVSVGPPVIFDPADEPPAEPHAVLLLAGLRPHMPELAASIRAAAACGAAAVVVKARGEATDDLARRADAARIAALVAPDETPWERIQAMLATAINGRLGGRRSSDVRAAANEDLLLLANATARAAGGAVTIEDAQRTIMAYSNLAGQPIDHIRRDGILARRIPEHPLNDVQYRRLAGTPGAVRFPADPDDQTLARVAIAVRAGTQVLGSIWVIDSGGASPPAVDAALGEAAETAALYLLRARATADLERHGRGVHLGSLIAGRDLGGAGARALGIPAGTRFAMVGFEIADGGQPVIDPQLEIEIDRFCHAFRATCASVRLESTVYLLVPLSRRTAGVRRLALGAAEHASAALRLPVQAALGGPSDDPAAIVRLRREVDAILRVARFAAEMPRLATAADVRLRIVLDHLADLLAAEPQLAHPGVRAIADHDREHGSAYVETLLARLETGDAQAAAARLAVHRNTVGYRIGQARDRFGIDLTDADDRLLVWLQLRSARVHTEGPRPGGPR